MTTYEVHGPSGRSPLKRFTDPRQAIQEAATRIYTTVGSREHALERLERGKEATFVYGFSEVTIYVRSASSRDAHARTRSKTRPSSPSRRDPKRPSTLEYNNPDLDYAAADYYGSKPFSQMTPSSVGTHGWRGTRTLVPSSAARAPKLADAGSRSSDPSYHP